MNDVVKKMWMLLVVGSNLMIIAWGPSQLLHHLICTFPTYLGNDSSLRFQGYL